MRRFAWLSGTSHVQRRSIAVAVVVVVVAFGSIYARRVASGYSNVDDYLYALQSRSYLTGLGHGPRGLWGAWRSFGFQSPLVPTVALPIAAFSTNPNTLVLVQLPAAIALLVACRFLFSQLRPAGSADWAKAAAIVCLPPVLGYTAMLHFAVAATACCVGALACYLASDRLRRLGPTLGFGLTLGLLGIARVLAPVYFAALLAPAAIDMLRDRQDLSLRLKRCALAGATAVLVAGPWWWLNRRSALRYLFDTGYDTGQRSPVQLLWHRLAHTADETGWLLAIAIVALMGLALFQAVRRGNRPIVLSSVVVTLGILALATSDNTGTAFALPFVVIGACIAASGLAGSARSTIIVAIVLAASVVLPSSSLVGQHRPLWAVGVPGDHQAKKALGCDCQPPDTDQLNREVLSHLVEPALVVRDDPLVNINSLKFHREGVLLLELDRGARSAPAAMLAKARTVLTGSTAASFYSQFDFAAFDSELRAAGFVPTWQRRLSPANEVVVWSRAG